MKRLVAIESPINAVASAAPPTKSTAPPQASRIASAISRSGTCRSGFEVNSPVGATSAFTTARVWPPLILAIASSDAATIMSQPMTRRASPAAMRTAWMSSGFGAMRMCE
jgi:hypothetical protein